MGVGVIFVIFCGAGKSEPPKISEEVGGPTWIRTRDQPVMSRWL